MSAPVHTETVVQVCDGATDVGARRVWSALNVNVRCGEFVAVLGPNGSGKSTLIKAILGLQQLSAGTMSVLGATPGTHNDRIGYLPQRRSFDRSLRMRGVDVVRLGLDGDRWGLPLPAFGRFRKQREREDARVNEVLQRVGGLAYARRAIGEVSGGEQQRVLIAQALVRRPDLLLLDEPLDSLDLPNQANVAGLLSDICRHDRVTVMLVAHDVNPILPYVDRVVYLARGGAVVGRPRER